MTLVSDPNLLHIASPKQHLDLQLCHQFRAQIHTGMSTLCSMEVIDVGSMALDWSKAKKAHVAHDSYYMDSQALQRWLTKSCWFHTWLTSASTIKIEVSWKWRVSSPSYSANIPCKTVCRCRSTPLPFGRVSAKLVSWWLFCCKISC